MVTFSTSENRLPLWIEAMRIRYQDGLQNKENITARWEEQESTSNSTKCKKVIISLSSTKNSTSKNLITITVSINLGRIQIQGKLFKDWSSLEFPALLEIIDTDPSKTNPTKDLEIFIEIMIKNKKNQPQMTLDDNSQQQTDEPNCLSEESEPTFITNMKNTLSAMQADYIFFKQTLMNLQHS
jgi:hypothetical protein